jgi:hypothetical protein
LLAAFGGWHDPVAALLRATPAEGFLWDDARALETHADAGGGTGSFWGSRAERAPASGAAAWSARVVLVGDAAHGRDPVLAQGTGIAVEDGEGFTPKKHGHEGASRSVSRLKALPASKRVGFDRNNQSLVGASCFRL